MSFFNRPISTKRFSGISLRKFWLRCNSKTFVRLRKALEWILWILFAVRSKIMRFPKFLKCFPLMCVRRFFFMYKHCRCIRLPKASDAILSIENDKKIKFKWQSFRNKIESRSYLPIKFSESRKVFKFFWCSKSVLLMVEISFLDTSSSSNSSCSWRFGKSFNLLCAKLITSKSI